MKSVPKNLFNYTRLALIDHEGYRLYPYPDEFGNITIGVGYNLSANGIDKEWVEKRTTTDITFYYNEFLNTFPWFDSLVDPRKTCLIDMAYMGWKKMLTFHNLFEFISEKKYEEAANEIVDSEWAKEVQPKRVKDNYILMKTGEYNF